MAWLANPFAYIGINTLIAVMPGIARRLELSTMLAGFWGSFWCFARLGTFVGLWLWPGWHYRFRWLLAAYLALVGAFITILLAPNLPVLVAAQIVFGGAIGLIYYSSLFYSMDSSETKGEHGGIHESAIGLGNWPARQWAPRRCNSFHNTATAALWQSPSCCSAGWAAWLRSGGREGDHSQGRCIMVRARGRQGLPAMPTCLWGSAIAYGRAVAGLEFAVTCGGAPPQAKQSRKASEWTRPRGRPGVDLHGGFGKGVVSAVRLLWR